MPKTKTTDKNSPLSAHIQNGMDALQADLDQIDESWRPLFAPVVNCLTWTNFNNPDGRIFLHKVCRLLHYLALYAEEELYRSQTKGGK